MRKEIKYMQVTDDLTGREVAEDSAKTHKVSFGGKSYEVDLTAESADALLKFFSHEGTADLIRLLGTDSAGSRQRRRATAGTGTGTRRSGSATAGQIKLPDGRFVSRDDYTSWARANRHKVNDGRGAQPKATLEAYARAHPAGSRPAVTTPAPGTVPAAPAAASAATPAAARAS